jgi:RNA polymerase sigma-70 factor (ECF subfamily)
VSATSVPLELPAQQLLANVAPAADGEPDRDLVAAREGDTNAFLRLIRQHQARVFSLALRLTGRPEDAEELAQDTFLALYSQLPFLQSSQHVRHWVSRTVTHRSIDRLRSRTRRRESGCLDQMLLEIPTEDSTADPLLHRTLRALLMRLPEVPRAVLVLRFQEDMDLSDIAATMDLPLNTVKSHLRRSLEWLRAEGLDYGLEIAL